MFGFLTKNRFILQAIRLKSNVRLKNLSRFSTVYKSKTLQDATELSEGDRISGYLVEKIENVPELQLQTVKLTHEKTGAEHLHVHRDDSNNVFSVAFRTTPMDSTGVPHILEHTALCGSEKYPVRDPFFKMLSRSMATFMNAFTASDWTMYPFATQNAQDFENLMSVYLDAAFFPQLREDDFRQEGWRLENENVNNPNSPIILRGVVYNEMKGVFSDSQNLFAQAVQNYLLPNHTYGYVSGGDPMCIPKLSWEQLKLFHASHYHPSNSRFFTYGNLPLERHLEFINKHALEKFDKIDPKTSVPKEPRWSSPKESFISCQPDPMAADPNKQTTVSISYLLSDITNPFESFVASFICTLLTYGETAPFYQGLLESNIGSDFAPVCGYDGNTREASFTIGLCGINNDDVEQVRKIIEFTFDYVVRKGFKQEQIDALLHKIELSTKHQTAKFGLGLAVGVAGPWMHGGDPVENLKINEKVERFKKIMEKNPNYLQEKVKEYFIDNKHKLQVVMTPENGFEEKRQKNEKELLDSLVSTLTEEDKKVVYEKGLELQKIQNEVPNLDCLPSLQLKDVDKKVENVPISISNKNGVSIQFCEQPTNGVDYFRLISSTANLPSDLKPYLRLFTNVVASMGAGGKDFKQLSQAIDLKTGGIDVGTHITEHHSILDSVEEGIIFSSHCLHKNADDMFNLISDIFCSVNMSDMNRLTTLVKMAASEMANSISGSGHAYAMTHAGSYISPAGKLREQLGGMTQISLLKEVADSKDLSPVLEKLKSIANNVLNKNNIRVAINCNNESYDKLSNCVEDFIQRLNGSSIQSSTQNQKLSFFNTKDNFSPCETRVQYELPFSVNYMCKAVRTVPYTHADFASLRILSSLLSTRYLHKEIREKGGAYGGGSQCNPPGQFCFYSYRDPNSTETLKRFDESVKWAMDGEYSQKDIDEAKLMVFQKVDHPTAPGDKGTIHFLSGITDEMKQNHRDQLFSVKKSDLQDAAERFLLGNSSPSAFAFIGPKNKIIEEDSKWKIIKN